MKRHALYLGPIRLKNNPALHHRFQIVLDTTNGLGIDIPKNSETTKIYTHPNPELAEKHLNGLPDYLVMRHDKTEEDSDLVKNLEG